jgi:hypothetical protein
MKKINVTFSIPDETHKMLHALVEHRKMSAFVTQAINSALSEEKEALKLAYIEADKDPDRKAVLDDWDQLETGDWE